MGEDQIQMSPLGQKSPSNQLELMSALLPSPGIKDSSLVPARRPSCPSAQSRREQLPSMSYRNTE